MDRMVIHLIIGVVCGVIAAAIASHKGRSVVGWFFAGFFIGIVGIIIVACLSNARQQQAIRAQADSERRRLREQLRQERLKHEAFRQHSASRLDAHDNALGLDTRRQEALPGPVPGGTLNDHTRALQAMASGSDAPPPVPAFATPFGEIATLWYFEDHGETRGPSSELEIKHMLRTGKILPTTLLWAEGLGDWTPANLIETFRAAVNP